MKLFAVEIRTVAIVVADSGSEAERVAMRLRLKIQYDDDGAAEFLVLNEVKSQEDLAPHGWDDDCVPYGAKDHRTIWQYLSEAK